MVGVNHSGNYYMLGIFHKWNKKLILTNQETKDKNNKIIKII